MGNNKGINNISEQLLALIQEMAQKTFASLVRESRILTITPVLVKEYDTGTKRATVAFLSATDVQTNYAYANKTGRTLTPGEKVYLIYEMGNLGQGWIDDNLSTGGAPLGVLNISIPANGFVADDTYETYPYRAAIPIASATVDMIPEVAFTLAQIESGNFAPVFYAYNGGVYIYSKKTNSDVVIIPSIYLVNTRE